MCKKQTFYSVVINIFILPHFTPLTRNRGVEHHGMRLPSVAVPGCDSLARLSPSVTNLRSAKVRRAKLVGPPSHLRRDVAPSHITSFRENGAAESRTRPDGPGVRLPSVAVPGCDWSTRLSPSVTNLRGAKVRRAKLVGPPRVELGSYAPHAHRIPLPHGPWVHS